jgi:hypothetical protein
MGKKRILFGAVDIGWRIEHYTNYIHTQFAGEVKAESFVKFKLPEQQYKCDYTYAINYYKYPKIIQWIISLTFFIYALIKYDVFYFISGETLLTRKLMSIELSIYKLLKKKIIFHFVGADIRNSEILYWRNENPEKYFNHHLKNQPPVQTEWQKKLCEYALKYADIIFVSTPDLLHYFKDLQKVYFIPVFLNIEKFEKEYIETINNFDKKNTKKNMITILHAPSNKKVKGTDYISKIIRNIQTNYVSIEFLDTSDPKYSEAIHPPYTVSKYTLYELYNKADIVIDQILIGWYGLQSVESLYLGKETISYIEPELKKYCFNEGIIHDCNNGLEKAVKDAIDRIRNERNIRSQYKEFVLTHHTLENSKWPELIQKVIRNEN